MIFPIGDDNIEGGHKPIVAYSLLTINVLLFLYQVFIVSTSLDSFLTHYGIIPAEIMAGEDFFTFGTSIFLHAGIFHLLGNMMFLWIFGDNIEAIIGSAAFLAYYIVGGLLASVVHILIDPSSTLPTVGASGAISALMGTYLVMFPKSRIKMLVIFWKFYIPAFLFLGFWFVQQLMSGLGSIGLGGEEAGGVAWWAHIGGFVYGIAIGFLFKKRYKICHRV